MTCPLCHAVDAELWHQRAGKDYWCCRQCQLVFVPSSQHLDPIREKAEYDRHENEVYDPGYRRFLSRTFNAVTRALPPGATGLDFGCGPGPALAVMLRDAGYPTALFDAYYHCDDTVWKNRYDFVTLTEVIEHLARPDHELARLWRHLKPGGCLAIQTQRVRDQSAFRNWRYTHDPTHIAFYAEATFHWLADWLEAERLELPERDVAVLFKPDYAELDL